MENGVCEPALYPATTGEIAAEVVRDPNAARVVRLLETNPSGPDETDPAVAVSDGLDLSRYFWRGPESGVAAGGLWGRWWVSLTDSASVVGRVVRPAPLRLDAGRPLTITTRLDSGSLDAVLVLSGSSRTGLELLNEMVTSPDLRARLDAAEGVNPHYSAVLNGRIPVSGSGALVGVGCTVPKVSVSIDGLDSVYASQSDPLWRAGIERMDWIFSGENEFRAVDVYRQLNWTLAPSAPPVSGSWSEFPWPYAAEGYDAYIGEVSASVAKWSQPTAVTAQAGDDAVALNQKRLEGFIKEVNVVLNRINADSNIIRGLQILGGSTRIRQVPKRDVQFAKPKNTLLNTLVSGGPIFQPGGAFNAVFGNGQQVSTVTNTTTPVITASN